MPRQREIMVGSRDQFGVKIAFLADPDSGAPPQENIPSRGALSKSGRMAIISAVMSNRASRLTQPTGTSFQSFDGLHRTGTFCCMRSGFR